MKQPPSLEKNSQLQPQYHYLRSFLNHSLKSIPNYSITSNTEKSLHSKSDITYAMLSQLKNIKVTLASKQQNARHFLQQKKIIQQQITRQQFNQLQKMKQTKTINQLIFNVLKTVDQLNSRVESWVNKQAENIQKVSRNQPCEEVASQRAKQHGAIFQAIYNFQNQINTFLIKSESLDESKFSHKSFQDKVRKQNAVENEQKIFKLKKKAYSKIISKIKQSDEQYRQKIDKVENIISKAGLPLQKSKTDQFEALSQEHQNFITNYLHYQYCSHSLNRILKKLSVRDDEQKLRSSQLLNSQSIQRSKITQPNSSPFFKIFWHRVFKAINYIFLSHNESHNIEEPAWLFQYMQETFNMNFRVFMENLLSKTFPEIALTQIRNYILSYNLQYFFLQCIVHRLGVDLNDMMEEPFLIFNFLDQVYQFQEKLSITFSLSDLDFIQRILLQFKEDKLLSRNFLHEQQWIETKIFCDFYNMDYSRINPKNIEAYNIVQNYVTLFQKLYSKFRKVKNPALVEQIQGFYQDSIFQLIAHIKTSFDRIYNYSGLNKFQIIWAYKRVQNQFRGYFSTILNQNPSFESKVQEEYYGYLSQFFTIHALQELGSVHKKIIKKIIQFNGQLTRPVVQLAKSFKSKQDYQEKRRQKIIAFKQIYRQWQSKIENLSRIQQYSDQKVKNLFFVYLESTQFSAEGFEFFKQIFAPFLTDIYSNNGFRTLYHLLDLHRVVLDQQLENPSSSLSFLKDKQIQSIKKKLIR